MSIIVDPTNEDSNFHIKLEDKDGQVIGLVIADANGAPDPAFLRRELYKGSTVVTKPPSGRFDDRLPPYNAVDQSEFGSGRGQRDFERNSTKFYDSGFLWTIEGDRIFPAPLFNLTDGYIDGQWSLPGNVSFQKVLDSYADMAVSLTADDNYSVDNIGLVLRPIGEPGAITIALMSATAGEPNAVLQSTTLAYNATGMEKLLSQWRIVQITAQAVVSTTEYFVSVKADSGDDANNHWEVGVEAQSGDQFYSDDGGTTWTATNDFYMHYYVGDNLGTRRRWLFFYKNALYMVDQEDDGTAPQLYLNGDRGVATGTHSTTTLQDTTQAWTVDEWIGCVVAFWTTAGDIQYSAITDNDADTLTFDTVSVAPTNASSLYVILGADTWQLVTGTGCTKPITDRPLVSGDSIYFPQGDSTDIRRVRFYNNAGTWTTQSADDGSNQFTYLCFGMSPDGEPNIFAATNSDASSNVSVSRSAVKAWGTDLAFTEGSSPIQIGTDDHPIRRIGSYDKFVWVLKEDGLYAIYQDAVDEIVGEFETISTSKTGYVFGSNTPYLYFNIGNFLQQFFERQMTNIGPERDAGLKSYQKGYPSSMAVTPKHHYISIDAGSAGISSILMFGGDGWHNIHNAPYGEEIRDICLQTIPGLPTRLWSTTQNLVGYQEIGEKVHNPEEDTNVQWHWESWLTTSWFSDNLLDIDKYWANLKLFTEGLDDGNGVRLYVEYQTDDDTDTSDWNEFNTLYDTSPSQTQEVGHGFVEGRRIRFRFRFLTETGETHARKATLKALVPDYVARFPSAYSFSARVVWAEESDSPMEDINGDDADFTMKVAHDFLERAKTDAVPLRMHTILSEINDLRVLVDPASMNVMDVVPGEYRRVLAHLRMLEVG